MEQNEFPLNFSLDPIDKGGGDLSFGDIKFPRQANPDGVSPIVLTDADGSKYVQLHVQRGKFTPKDQEPDDDQYDRCELREAKKLPLGKKVFYGFSLRATHGFPSVAARCVIAQVKIPFGESTFSSPVISLRIENGHYTATLEHYYDKDDEANGAIELSPSAPDGTCPVGSTLATDHHEFDRNSCASREDHDRDHARCPLSEQVRVLMATDSAGPPNYLLEHKKFDKCSTGVTLQGDGRLPDDIFAWNDFAFCVKSSGQRDTPGTVSLYVNGALIKTATGEFGVPQQGMRPEQYFKIGPYRNDHDDWGDGPSGIEVRRIQRGSRPQDVGLASDALVASNDAGKAPSTA